ncbi:MAG TPA: Lrp/AsnC family transcriptional regulator [Pseudolysinimonas sp.]|nr:Lrp/AsnC family transcriptional regulator [Pseudolysinimonas sp.]
MADMARDIRSDSLDEVDRRILDLLREDARTPNSRLAELAGIAPSTCLARVRGLVERGVITGFTAAVSPAALGLGIEALISVSIRTGARQRITEFRDDLEHRPEVRQLFFLGGAEDFVLHVAVHDTDALREFVVEQLSAHPAVASTRTSVVFQHHENLKF